MFCTHCGNELPESEAVAEIAADAVVESVAAEVEIARIQADRDIQLAKLQLRATDVEQVAELAAAEAVADVLTDIVAPPEETPQEPATVVVEAPTQEVDTEPAPTDMPRAEEHSEPHHETKSPSYGSKGWFS
jgi:hypothetical protein